MDIEILYIRDCPNHAVTAERIRQVLREFGLPETVRETEIKEAHSARNGFLGSPTVLINGLDVEFSARHSLPQLSGLSCRTYANASGKDSLLSLEAIREAVQEAISKEAPESSNPPRVRKPGTHVPSGNRLIARCSECDRLWREYSATMVQHLKLENNLKLRALQQDNFAIERLTVAAKIAAIARDAARENIRKHETKHDNAEAAIGGD